MEENGRQDPSAMSRAIEEERLTRAYVRVLIEDELQRSVDPQMDDEPEVAFTVKLPVTDLGLLERIGSYLGHKKTPFASMLLREAIQDAFHGLLVASEEYPGKREEVEAYLRQPHQLEDGSGTVTWGV